MTVRRGRCNRRTPSNGTPMNRDLQDVALNLQQSVAHIELRRPEKRNALTLSMFAALADLLAEAEEDPRARVILVSGAGSTFCAGHDLEAFSAWPQRPEDPVPRFLHAIAAVRKPVVMAVQGAAAGIGVTWLLHADWVVAAPDARLRLPFVDLGIAPEGASTVLLAKAVGSQRAKRLLMSAEPFTGVQAHDWGLVTELAPAAALIDVARERATRLATKDPIALRRVKDWLHPPGEFDARIDEEIDGINAAVLRQRHTGVAP